MINRVVLVGRITRDPELKATASGISVVTFSLAVNRNFSGQQGERQADFIQCVVWRNQAENLAKYIRKGALLGVEGRIQTRNYETDQGVRYITEVQCDSVQFLESKSTNTNQNDSFGSSFKDDAQNELYDTSMALASDDDLPF